MPQRHVLARHVTLIPIEMGGVDGKPDGSTSSANMSFSSSSLKKRKNEELYVGEESFTVITASSTSSNSMFCEADAKKQRYN